ncbi:universal stress protein [Kineococcus aurantiacus]|uniref:Nucleotide-binding universal stress UspA family protein n=1 Tax=Kineococcus aurantiacus TaxID=37633 RepID=A0A7Y9DNC5_9ACTN|nr:universal stress protein [Kineococcus aurantiacus]NYD23775.1 nucleotide-binding universal stress UspA family protein [Kineococcus aurantiacus]
MGTVVVGLNTLENCRAAVEWAADAADRAGADLDIVCGVQPPPVVDTWSVGYGREVLDQLDAAAREELARARDLVRDRVRGEVGVRLVHDHPRPALLAAARGADLLVTGARPHHRLRSGVLGGLQLGSTSLYAAGHAPCPVVVVRGAPAEGARDLVVGFDGSPAAVAAARWAAGHAAATGGRVRVLLVQDPHRDGHRAGSLTAPVLEGFLDALRVRVPGARVSASVVRHHHPEDVLLEASGTCALLVVGARGHSALASALGGCTSHAVLHQAATPVAVVPRPAPV